MSATHYIGALAVLTLIIALGMYSGSRVKTAGDFAGNSRKVGAGIVAGTIIGTLVGGASTIGTAQLAFNFGFSAWWFTLGGGLACLILAVFYAKPLYDSGLSTIPQMLFKEYGRRVATTAMILTSLGSFLSIVSQALSSVALVTSVSSVPSWLAILTTLTLMIAYVLFGGLWGAGLVGIAKTILLSAAVGGCGLLALNLQGGWSGFSAVLPAEKFFSLTARGAAVDLGAGFSLVLGMLSTQAYIQAVISARSLKLSRSGVLIGAAVIPLIGVAGIVVGLYMRINFPDINPAGALPLFVLNFLPPLLAGMVLATLLVSVVGTAAGVALGISSMFCTDIYSVYRKSAGPGNPLLVSRITLAAILTAAALVSLGNLGSLILNWSFMSMGLRGAVACGALSMAVFRPGRIPAGYAFWSMIVGPICILIGKPLNGSFIDPLFIGVAGGLAVLAAGYFHGRDNSRPVDITG
jgi:SSS family solute:Na+ symporter